MRFLIFTGLFVILFAYAFVANQYKIMTLFGKYWPPYIQSTLQKDTLKAIQNIYEVNQLKKPSTFVLGSSNIEPFYKASRELSEDERDNIYSLNSGSQVIPDYIRLVENINVEGSTVILGISPHKFANMWYDRAMIETHYLYGMAGKFVLPSKNFDELWNEYINTINVKDVSNKSETLWWQQQYLGVTNKHWRIFQPTMPYVYFMNDLIDHNKNEVINYLKSNIKPIEKIKKTQPIQKLNKNNLFKGADNYLNHISEKKLREFREWRDFSMKQFDESVFESFKMLNQVIEIARRKSLNIIIAEAPVAEIEDEELMPYLKKYESGIDKLIQENSMKEDLTVFRFDRNKFDNNQKYFSDYVHINSDGYNYYKNYLQSVFFKHQKRTTEKKNIPITWDKNNTVILATDSWIRHDILNSLDKRKIPFEKKSSPLNLNNSKNLKISYQPFIDVLQSKPEEIKNVVHYEEKDQMFIEIENPQSKNSSYQFINAEIQTKYLDFSRLDMQWFTLKNDSKVKRKSLKPLHATPFIWAFGDNDIAKIENHIRGVKFNKLKPGDMWTKVMNVPIPKAPDNISIKLHKNIKSIKISKQAVDRLFYETEAAQKNNSFIEFDLPEVNFDQTKGKIAHSGIIFNIKNVKKLFYIDSKHKVHRINANFNQRFGSFLPHTFGIELTDGTYKTIYFQNSNLIDLDYHNEKKNLILQVYDYHAHENYSNGYDLLPSKVQIRELDKLNRGKIDSYRHYRNHGITDFLEKRKLSILISNSSKLVFPLWQRGGRQATLVFVEHADYQETSTDPHTMYGNKEHKLVKGEGFLGNNIPFTKTVFFTGKNLKWQFPKGDKLFNFIQPTFLDDAFFAKYLKDLHATGIIEIAAHQSGTIPYGNQQKAPSEALKILKSEFQGRVWTDHGGMPSNISFNGWDPRQKQYYVLDDLSNFAIDYLWAGPDYEPEEVKIRGNTSIDINMVRNNSANPIFYKLPMLKPSTNAWTPTFFKTLLTLQNLPTTDAVKELVENRGVSLLHVYLGHSELEYYDKGSGHKGVNIRPEFNTDLQGFAKLRDEGLLNIETISSYLDYLKFVRKLKIFQSDNGITKVDSDGEMSNVSFAQVSFGKNDIDREIKYFTSSMVDGTQTLVPNFNTNSSALSK